MDAKKPLLLGKVALVTGAAHGIGRAIVHAFVREGAAVALNYHTSEEEALSVVRALTDAGGKAIAVRADVSRYDQVQEMVHRVIEAFGRIDILVNNAGRIDRTPFRELSEESWDAMMAVNLKGPFLCVQAVLPYMERQGGGVILNIGSMRGLIGGGAVHYAVSKAGLLMLTKCLAAELAPHIRVNAIAPGYTETRIQAYLTLERRREIAERIPLRRFATPEEVARAAVFLASDRARYITGQTLVVDGGMSMY
ncbi:MAG: 3-oxoacyl-ACP reductase family protein [Armatimonadota bacterium]|nr:3-oxoacyl-ACP reductase family protein [Armatimonadota bacterium]